MALLGPSTDYTDKDFDALSARCRNLIRSTFPEWTDEEVANFGNILVDLFCFVGDVLTKYQDNQAAEAFIGRITQRKNMLALIKMLGYEARSNTASEVDLILTLATSTAGDVNILARDQFRTENVVDPVVFEAESSALIPAGTVGPITITVENATLRSELFTSTALADQEFRLNGTPFLDGSLTVTAGDGAYTVVDSFLDSGSTDKHVTVIVDQNDRATVRFGDGVNGSIPSGSVTIGYKTGGGVAGRVEAGTVTRANKTYVDTLGNPVVMQVTNVSASTPALDRQSLNSIRLNAPRSLRVNTRTVAREDYEINAERVPGVARSLMLTSDQYEPIEENAGILYIVAEGGVPATTQMKADVLTMVTVTYPNTLTFFVQVIEAPRLLVDVTTSIWVRAGQTPSVVRDRVIASLQALFAITNVDGTPNENINFGYYLREEGDDESGKLAYSDIYNAIRDTSGVRKIDDGGDGLLLNGSIDDPTVALYQFPQLGSVVVINAETGVAI